MRAIALEVTGRPAVDVRLRHAAKGLTAYMTVQVGADQSLRDAHRLATLVEDRIVALS